MEKIPLIEKKHVFTFVLITSLFALWGFANDITNPMVAAFQTVMEISATKASLVQFAFYGGYATMAVPAALFIQKYSYKHGIVLGLTLYAAGAFLFIPAAKYQAFSFFCISLYILTFGLAFLETTANPFVLSLGSKHSATRRLNLAQAFNPMGSLAGMAVASFAVLPHLLSDRRDSMGQIVFPTLSAAEKSHIRLHDLAVIRDPYVAIGLVVVMMLAAFLFVRMPEKSSPVSTSFPSGNTFSDSLRHLRANPTYRRGVAAQACYVAAQIMTWTFIIQYADHLGINKATAQRYNMVAMVLFLCGRFAGTYLLKYVAPGKLLSAFGIGAALCCAGAVAIDGMLGLYCLAGISFFMSIMFPCIYGIALQEVAPGDTPLGAAFLVMSIVGGALFPPLQGAVIDCGTIMGHPAVNWSYLLPLLCFVIVIAYGYTTCSKTKT